MDCWFEAAFRHITIVRVERETDECIWVDGQRRKKMTAWRSYFRTWEDAKLWLLDLAEQDVNAARRQLEIANSHYGNIKGMRSPARAPVTEGASNGDQG